MNPEPRKISERTSLKAEAKYLRKVIAKHKSLLALRGKVEHLRQQERDLIRQVECDSF